MQWERKNLNRLLNLGWTHETQSGWWRYKYEDGKVITSTAAALLDVLYGKSSSPEKIVRGFVTRRTGGYNWKTAHLSIGAGKRAVVKFSTEVVHK